MKVFLMIFTLFLLNGCTSYRVITNVTRTAKNFDKNKNICIPLPEKSKNDLELSTYKSYIENILSKNGYKVDSKACEYTLLMEYGVWSGEELISTPVMTMTNTQFGQQMQVSGYRAHKNTYYTRKLNINVFDKNDNKVFQANAVSDGGSPQFMPISQCVIKAIFKEITQDGNKSDYSEYFEDTCRVN
jgi:hypothetical protein